MGRPLAALSVLLQPLGLAGPFGTAREPFPCFWCLCRLPVLPRPALQMGTHAWVCPLCSLCHLHLQVDTVI